MICSIRFMRCLSFIEFWVCFLGLCTNGWDFQGVGFFGITVKVGPPRVGKSLSAAENCVSSGWSVYYKPRGQW